MAVYCYLCQKEAEAHAMVPLPEVGHYAAICVPCILECHHKQAMRPYMQEAKQ